MNYFQREPGASAPRRRHALIFGGFGMQSKHCSELAGIYSEHGASEVVALCHPLRQMVVPRLGLRRARKLAGNFARFGQGDDVVVHLFSGAVFIFFIMLKYMPEQARQSIRAVVFESSPMDCGAEQFGRYVSWRLGRTYRPLYAAPFVPLRPMTGITRRFEAQLREGRFILAPEAKIHFIQCKDDQIVDASYIDDYRRQLEARGHDTSERTYSGARHCRALSDCPADYRTDMAGLLHAYWGEAGIRSETSHQL